MRVIVTGGNGQIGRHVVQRLLSQGHETGILDLQNPDPIPNTQFFQGDCRDPDFITQAFSGYDRVIHLAGLRGPAMGSSSEIFNINCRGTYHVMEACVKTGIQRVSLASSINALGFLFGNREPQVQYFPVDEDHPKTCSDPYSFSKHILEEIGCFFWYKNGISSVSMRIPIVLHDKRNPVKFVHQIRENPGDGYYKKNLWSWIDIRDVASALVAGIEKNYEGSHILSCNHSHNASGIPSRELAQKYFAEVKIWKRDIQGTESLMSNLKTRELLGWEPQHHLEPLAAMEKAP